MRSIDQARAAHNSAVQRNECSTDLEAAIVSLPRMQVGALRTEWRRLYRSEPPKRLRRDTLQLAVAWKLQARVLGGLSASATRQLAGLAAAIADGSDLPKQRQVSLRPGARLVRQWGGETHEILVTERGFVWRERSWKSLSVIAREITGARWSGPRFFGLDRAGASGRRRGRGEGADASL